MDFFHLSVFHISVWGLTAPGNPQTSNPAANPSPQLCGQWVSSNPRAPLQHQKNKADAVLSSTIVEIPTVAADGKVRTMTMLPKEMAPGWLFTIKKVAPEVQAKLNRFRLECFVALDAWFNKGLRNDWKTQYRKLMDDEVLSSTVVEMPTMSWQAAC